MDRDAPSKTNASPLAARQLARQLRRHVGIATPDELEAAVAALVRAGQADARLTGLAKGLVPLLSGVAESYAQYERDLDLRTRSLLLSSEELMQANEQLRQSAQTESQRLKGQLVSAIEALDIGFAMFDENDRLVVFNHRFVQYYPQVADQIRPGLTLAGFYTTLYRAQVPGIVRDLPEAEWVANRVARRGSGEVRETHHNGRWLAARDLQTDTGLTISLRTDFTSVKRHAIELAAARDSAEAASRAKSEFLANMSHEIRTPMNAIIGMSALTLATPLTAEQQEYVNIVKSSADALLTVINDILDVSKMEAGMLHIDAIPFALEETLRECLRPHELQAAGKGLTLALEVDPALPASLVGDPMRVRQIVHNLVGNAIKFTTQGGVAVTARLARLATPRVSVRLEVRDTGIGIAPEQLEHIFEAFTQADGSITRRFGGTGLGLTICKRLVSLMGGEIQVRSELGQGSVFAVELDLLLPEAKPASAAGAQATGQPDAAPPRGLRVLVVEDHPVNQRLATIVLERMGHTVEVADNGANAVHRSAAKPYDLILMDMQMPEMDGLDATRAIRAREAPLQRHTPIVAMTANAMTGDRERCLAAGMDGYVSKPIDLSLLRHEIARVCRGDPSVGDVPIRTADATLRRAELIERLGGDEQLAADLLAMFLREAPEIVRRLRAAAQGRKHAEATVIAQRLVDSAKGLAAQALAQAAMQADLAAQAQDATGLSSAVSEIERCIERLHAFRWT